MGTDLNHPQPYEGIAGTDRDDDLLSLEDEAVPRRLLMHGMAGVLRDAVLVGNPAPRVARMWERMKDPQPGDLVAETSTFHRADEDTRIKALGILVAHRVEWWQTDGEWAAAMADEPAELRGNGNRATDHAWYVQYGPQAGDICRWVNCEFITVLTGPSGYDVPVGTRDGGGVTLTRNDLLGALADSGFALRDPGER